MAQQPVDSRDFQLTDDKQHLAAVRNFLSPLPRSVIRPGAFELLDGEWRFDLDLEDRGLLEKWYLGHQYRSTASWPSTIESQMAAAQDTQRQTGPLHDETIAWYERDFTIPAEWLQAPDSILQITFGACGYETRVWLNGHPLRTIEGAEVHFGEYTSFSYELPAEAVQPTNRLTVRIADSLDAEIPRGKQESRVYKRGGIWYQTISGPVRSIWLEPVQRNRLRSRLGVYSDTEDKLVQFTLTTRVRDPGLYKLRLVALRQGHTSPAVSEYDLALEAGEKRQRVVLEIPGAVLWSPLQPNMYHLTAQLFDPNGGISQIEADFGLRKIEARGRYIYLNNEKIYLDGILYQPATSTFEQICSHMAAMKALGCNLVRVHIAGIDPRIYDLADEMGMLLWVEVPSPHSSSQRSRDNHWDELMRMLVIVASHPSVIICSLYNEDWGVQDIAANMLTREYITRVYDYMALYYPQLLVVDNDGWHHVSLEGRLQSDLLTAHVYTTGIEEWRSRLDSLVSGDLASVTVAPLIVGDPFFYRGQIPLLVSEWGGFGWSGYGGPEESGERADKIRAFKAELRTRPIAGDIYTQATSIEQETNGIIEPATGDLLVPPGILGPA